MCSYEHPLQRKPTKTVGLITLGQSPRQDVVSEIEPLLFPHIRIVQRGLLDDLAAEDIQKLNFPHIRIVQRGLLDDLAAEDIQKLDPPGGGFPLVTRLRDGSEVRISEREAALLLMAALEAMHEESDVDAVGVLCTHSFSRFKFPVPVILPFDVMEFLVNQVLTAKLVGIVVPLPEQVELSRFKWKNPSLVESKSPYSAGESWKAVAGRLKRKKLDAAILDCIGYSMEDKTELESFLSVPVLLPRTILASTINQIV
jgi:protein AroM